MSFIIGQPSSGGGGGADIPQIKGTSINYVPGANSTLTGGVNGAPQQVQGIVFDVPGAVSSTGIVLDVVTAEAGQIMQIALYKYDYDTDVWNIATEQMDVAMDATGVVSQDFTTPQALTAGKYCVGFRPSGTSMTIMGFYKLRSTNNFSGSFTSMTGFKNTMITNTISYSATLPATVTFPSANFVEYLYSATFQIKF
tara:strand:- start:6 stop:596 length:591 start_codon:yes stop_codon:yes gene_type:complete